MEIAQRIQMSQQNTINMLNQLMQRTGRVNASTTSMNNTWGQMQLMRNVQQSPSVIDIELDMDDVMTDIQKAKTKASSLQMNQSASDQFDINFFENALMKTMQK
ncbi:Hypothetical_protein [Hexamita inflata]|uniref:Hypothetical_protein n=1 Tax=Hexamita inflata TaxID=28002 RepID=A0AA86RAQ9_9EUKA|nr:Hypothetical protein HINF_LOCUS25284 [Hexamita inflata]CAI9944524.1 Hypothetical protein HINF_LOCUS32169 [Hexamita inflata]CAI9949047.1 Hypothetical protein HINF_LOCUS36692 [Hexamita inflata]CAI9969109.1 Hypothetical protein HINF_LOCUS56754 [Hexamita inflata]